MSVTVKKKAPAIKKFSYSRSNGKSKVAGNYRKYDEFKHHDGKFYTGMQVGRSHKWYYDKGEWKETKITPDLWRIFFSVKKRRAGKAPEGTGAAVGTAYHWYIMAHQRVQKLNANDYSTTMMGLKYKLAHKRAATGKWSAKEAGQRKLLIGFLKEWLKELEKEVIPLEFDYKEETFKGEGVPIPETCHDGVCTQLDITLNGESY